MAPLEKSDKPFDYVFVGLGAGNSLLVLSLIKKGVFENKRVAILESSAKSENDKTYCFWAGSQDPITSDLAPIISHRYTRIKLGASVLQNIESTPYHYIKSIDLYAHTRQSVERAGIPIFRESVESISREGDAYSISAGHKRYMSRYIFDSRPPSLQNLGEKEIHIHQSFFGVQIATGQDRFDENAFEMMNFEVEQSGFTQFVYVLPFSKREALVELTRFGSKKMAEASAMKILEDFISREFGRYEVVERETGCIPMTTFQNPPNPQRGILNTGASANAIKPSTGYGFKKMYESAEHISQKLAENRDENFNQIALKSKQRFKFYDRLLLLILSLWPEQGKRIFTRLYNRQSIQTIFDFLDERTNLFQEFKIFASLPPLYFLKALWIVFKRERGIRYLAALAFSLIYFALAVFDSELALAYSYVPLALGLLLRGIPHGAVDHLLDQKRRGSSIGFVLKYLFIIGLYFGFWWLFPIPALVLFVLFSSFHFGESEIEESGIQTSSFGQYLNAFLLGLSILTFIISTHVHESLNIIAAISSLEPSLFDSQRDSGLALVLAAASFTYILFQHLSDQKQSHYGLLFLLLLGIKLPLMAAFGLYFIVQHSENAWSHIKTGLNIGSGALFQKALPFTFGAFLLLTVMVFVKAENIVDMDGLWASFFIFIACISLPHFVMMHLFYKPKLD